MWPARSCFKIYLKYLHCVCDMLSLVLSVPPIYILQLSTNCNRGSIVSSVVALLVS